MNWADILVFILGAFLILSVALQEAQDNIKDAFSGSKSDLFKDKKVRGIELFLMRATFVIAILFVGMIFVTLFLHSR
ncbi:MAG: preprotein translocase subunit SecG [Acholeplasmataceae bacterium]|jgi:preprotein translocase subunit SecG|nr:preprotein translocase subunit SecG [Acholeplasmataceae bacterium]